MRSFKKTAFTLAEVLITLGIIGIVAAVTMPTLIQHHQKQVTVTKLKKVYSELTQTLQKAENEHGMMETWDFSGFETALDTGKYFGENYLFPYMKTIKICIPSSNECWADDVMALSNITEKELVNTQKNHISFTTASRYSVYYWVGKSGHSMAYYVDINGLKAPNKLGRDVFYFHTYWGNLNNSDNKLGVYPYGLQSKSVNYSRSAMLDGIGFLDGERACKKGNDYHNGGACAAVIMLDGWKIEKDYPW